MIEILIVIYLSINNEIEFIHLITISWKINEFLFYYLLNHECKIKFIHSFKKHE